MSQMATFHLFIAKQQCVCVCKNIFFIHSFVGRHLGCSHILTIVTDTSVNKEVISSAFLFYFNYILLSIGRIIYYYILVENIYIHTPASVLRGGCPGYYLRGSHARQASFLLYYLQVHPFIFCYDNSASFDHVYIFFRKELSIQLTLLPFIQKILI